MKVLKYILHILVFTVIYVAAMFIAPSLAGSRVGVFIILGVVTVAEMIYLGVVAKGKYFTAPISIFLIMLFGMFYFNHPSNQDMKVGMWVLARFLVLPYAIGSSVIAIVMHIVSRVKKRKELTDC